MDKQSSSTVLMVRPASFGYNQETAENNGFMTKPHGDSAEHTAKVAKKEFDGLVDALRAVGTHVIVVEDTKLPRKPDAVFPNNWFSTHPNGAVVTYPMYAVSRRIERDNPVLPTLQKTHLFSKTIALEYSEREEQYLEGTGSLVLDRINKVAYACESERTHPDLLKRWAELTGYTTVLFKAFDANKLPVYHTNVIMAMGTFHAVICLESVAPEDRHLVRDALIASGRQIIELSFNQILEYAGNMLEVLGDDKVPRWVMSTQAYMSLTIDQRSILEEKSPIVHAPIKTIETLGGGSARCMIAEVFLQPKA